MLDFGGTSMILDGFFPDSNTDGFRITQFLIHRMVQEVNFDRGVTTLSVKEFQDRMRIFQVLFEGNIFARGQRPTLKTFKADVRFLEEMKTEIFFSYVTEIR